VLWPRNKGVLVVCLHMYVLCKGMPWHSMHLCINTLCVYDTVCMCVCMCACMRVYVFRYIHTHTVTVIATGDVVTRSLYHNFYLANVTITPTCKMIDSQFPCFQLFCSST
jgi:hypothetical protein